MTVYDDITWEAVVEESLKKPEDPMAKMFLEQHARSKLLEELCHRIYKDSSLRLKVGWCEDYERLLEND